MSVLRLDKCHDHLNCCMSRLLLAGDARGCGLIARMWRGRNGARSWNGIIGASRCLGLVTQTPESGSSVLPRRLMEEIAPGGFLPAIAPGTFCMRPCIAPD